MSITANLSKKGCLVTFLVDNVAATVSLTPQVSATACLSSYVSPLKWTVQAYQSLW